LIIFYNFKSTASLLVESHRLAGSEPKYLKELKIEEKSDLDLRHRRGGLISGGQK
jgi:hypothetical protein